MSLVSGTQLGPYEILGPLGAGGMGEVYRARDVKLGREVALKILPDLLSRDPERLARFEREARTLASLNHPNIAQLYGVYEADEAAASRALPATALVMELVDGPTLADLVARGPMPADDTLAIARQIAEALEVAHDQGIVHRDLKPANVKVRPDGVVKVLDFGLAKALTGDMASGVQDPSHPPTMTTPAMTQAGVIMGTAAYMSPEQARGRTVDRRADIWAFGCVLYEMLTGQAAFARESTTDTLSAITRDEPDWTARSGLTPDITRLLRRCLEKDPRMRLRDIGEARIAIAGLGQDSLTTTPDAMSARPARARLGPVALLAGALVVAAIASGVTWIIRDRTIQAPASPIQTDLTRITSDPGLTIDPAVAPNGSLLAYASDRGGANLNIWVQPLPTGQPVQVTRGDVDARQPSFSPDGSRIVFRSERDGGGIYVVPALGGTERLVATKGQSPRFSPDGQRILYLTGGRGSASEAWIVDQAGGTPTRIGKDLREPGGAVWSPDGTAVLLSAYPKSGVVEWFRIELAGGAPLALGAASLFKAAGLVDVPTAIGAWLPGKVVFSARSGDSGSLWSVVIAADGRTITGPVRRLTAGTGLDQSPTVAGAPGSGQLYFTSLDTRSNIFRLPVAANEGRASGQPQAVTDAAARDVWPSVSADGRVLVYGSDRQSIPGLWLMDMTTTVRETPLGESPRSVVNVSPDGTRIAYFIKVQDKVRLATRSVGGGDVKVLPVDVRYLWDWPTPTLLTTGGEAQESNRLHAIDLTTGKLRPLLSGGTGQFYGHGRLSPDGRWMSAMEWTSAGRSRIIVFPYRDTPVPPGEFVAVTDEDSVAEESAWSPDGQVLYFVSERDGSRCIWARRLDARTKHPVGPIAAVLHMHGLRRSLISTLPSPARLALGADALFFAVELQRGNVWKVTLRDR